MILVKFVLECKDYSFSLIGRVVDESVVILEDRKKNIFFVVVVVFVLFFFNERVVFLCNVMIRR